jgi:isoleucyl-tRNA synthetase
MLPHAAEIPAGTGAPRPRAELPERPDLPSIEREVLRRWTRDGVAERSLAQTASGPQWTCYEAPLPAHGMPGIHHVPARAVNDLYQRLKTMQGFHVPRRPGWDCHGLPTEVAVEKELGLAGRAAIEAYGVPQFNARCRESALRHIEALSGLTRRIGLWADLSGAYRTMDPAYIESVWWSLRQIFDAGLLVRDFRVGPYCPRCQTALSEHELGQPHVFHNVTDTAVIVRFRLLTIPPGSNSRLGGADLLGWTSAPWTLVANTALAVHPDQTYVIARRAGHDDRVIVAEALLGRALGEGWHVAARLPGAELAGASYQAPFGPIEGSGGHRVVTSSLVTMQGGTGLVPLAPSYRAEDMRIARSQQLPIVHPIGPDGCFDQEQPVVGGLFFKEADPLVVAELADRGLLFASRPQPRVHPHCWRCGSPLLGYASRCWHIRVTAAREQLRADCERTSWVPAGAQDDQGERLRQAHDWALSRTRYWGTPLPLWECQHGHVTCVGSLAELSELAGRDLAGLDPHRPGVDMVTISCPQCGAQGHRVPEVIDAWYDAGAMPFAQYGAPWRGGAEFAAAFPAQFVAESAGRATGWLFALTTIGSLVLGQSPVRAALRIGEAVDERGRAMSKSLGNVVEPLSLIDQHGADALRWFFVAATPPWSAKKVSAAALEDIVSTVLLPYWDTVRFFLGSANAARQAWSWQPPVADAPPPAARPVLDRWMLTELHTLISEVTADFERFRTDAAGRRLARFVHDLSRWYLPRSQRRFLDKQSTRDRAAAIATLHDCLDALTRLMAPLAPFLSDYVWDLVRAPDAPDSVHLASWPVAAASLIDSQLTSQMAVARKLAELGQSARANAMVRADQPLARALIAADGVVGLGAEMRAHVAAELNVKQVDQLAAAGSNLGEVARGKYSVEVVDATSDLPGWAVAAEGAMLVALDTVITPQLRREGLASEVIRAIANARKSDGFADGDPVSVRWSTQDAELGAALIEHGARIGADVLAPDYGAETAGKCALPGAREHLDAGLGLTFWLRPLST